MKQRSIVFWNIHRMFEAEGSPIDYALSDDQPPETEAKNLIIREKTLTIAAVLDHIAEIAGPPLLVGFAEIESAALSQNIAENVRSASLAAVDIMARDDFGFALEGLNLSLLFDVDYFAKVERLRSHVIDRRFITRDILECDLRTQSGESVSVLLNHWPSRLISEAAATRLTAAHYVRSLVGSKTRFSLREMWDANQNTIVVPDQEDLEKKAATPTIVMGDFNDEMFDLSVEMLGSTYDKDAVLKDLNVKGQTKIDIFRSYRNSNTLLLNPFWSFAGRGGSYYRSPRWRCYDQIMMSRGVLLETGTLRYRPDSAGIFSQREVQRADGSMIELTNRNGKPISYEPGKNRGCSDHFAVFLSVEV
jgi:hypothetical protein